MDRVPNQEATARSQRTKADRLPSFVPEFVRERCENCRDAKEGDVEVHVVSFDQPVYGSIFLSVIRVKRFEAIEPLHHVPMLLL
jgi:hypothetical protein